MSILVTEPAPDEPRKSPTDAPLSDKPPPAAEDPDIRKGPLQDPPSKEPAAKDPPAEPAEPGEPPKKVEEPLGPATAS